MMHEKMNPKWKDDEDQFKRFQYDQKFGYCFLALKIFLGRSQF